MRSNGLVHTSRPAAAELCMSAWRQLNMRVRVPAVDSKCGVSVKLHQLSLCWACVAFLARGHQVESYTRVVTLQCCSYLPLPPPSCLPSALLLLLFLHETLICALFLICLFFRAVSHDFHFSHLIVFCFMKTVHDVTRCLSLAPVTRNNDWFVVTSHTLTGADLIDTSLLSTWHTDDWLISWLSACWL